MLCLSPTDHEVRHTGEDKGGDGPQRDDVRQDLGQEVDRHSVVTADVLVTDGRQKNTSRDLLINLISRVAQEAAVQLQSETRSCEFFKLNISCAVGAFVT